MTSADGQTESCGRERGEEEKTRSKKQERIKEEAANPDVSKLQEIIATYSNLTTPYQYIIRYQERNQRKRNMKRSCSSQPAQGG